MKVQKIQLGYHRHSYDEVILPASWINGLLFLINMHPRNPDTIYQIMDVFLE